jgi:hypothetical protein
MSDIKALELHSTSEETAIAKAIEMRMEAIADDKKAVSEYLTLCQIQMRMTSLFRQDKQVFPLLQDEAWLL